MMAKFMQSLDPHVYAELKRIAKDREIAVQELFRAIIFPEWLRAQGSTPRRQAELDEFSAKRKSSPRNRAAKGLHPVV